MEKVDSQVGAYVTVCKDTAVREATVAQSSIEKSRVKSRPMSISGLKKRNTSRSRTIATWRHRTCQQARGTHQGRRPHNSKTPPARRHAPHP